MPRPRFLAIFSALLTSAGTLFLASPAAAFRFAPEEPNSPNASDMTTAYWVLLIVGVVLVVAINVGLVIAVRRFRASRGDGAPAPLQSGTGVQMRVAGVLSVVALALFVFGIVYTEKTRDVAASSPNADAAPLEINVTGQRWLWRFDYPPVEGARTFSYEHLVVPVDTTVLLRITSVDVLHRWSIPALGGKIDALPGQHQETWFRAEEEGTYEGQSAAFSGPSYPTMQASVEVVGQAEYDAWLQQQHADLVEAQNSVQEQLDATATGAAE